MRVNLTFFIIVAFAVCANATKLYANDAKYCYASDPLRLQLKMFANTSPYDSDRGTAYNPTLCTPKRIWFLSRHGSRYPSIADSDTIISATDPIQSNILNNYALGKTTLCADDLKNIKEWRLDPVMLQTEGSANLSATGRVEVMNVAIRYQRLFPMLLPKKYSQRHYFFRNSPLLRTRQTAQAFAEGLFGAPTAYQQVNYTGGSTPDYFMYAFGSCPKWATLKSGTVAAEMQAFADGSEFQEMVTEVSNKLGFFGSEQLSTTEVIALITNCQYEVILSPDKTSAFCAAFSYANVQVYEYYKDLMFYYLVGYGPHKYRILYKNMNCYLVQDMLNFLQAKDNQKAKLSFGHDATIALLMVSMGLFKDAVPITASNFAQQADRKWRTSVMVPMAANLAVVKYDCLLGEDEVLFELNEKPLVIPGCGTNGVCKISVILKRLRYFANANCDTLFCNEVTILPRGGE